MPSRNGVPSSRVDALHGELRSVFETHLQLSELAKIVDTVGGRWERAQSDRVEFSLIEPNAETATRSRGGTTAVFALREAPAWCSWYECWIVQPGRKFALDAASLTVFVGERFGFKTQILRAEWDHVDSLSVADGTGQPHWHVDSRVTTFVDLPRPPVPENGLEPLSTIERDEVSQSLPASVSHLSVEAFHLAMHLLWKPQPRWRHRWTDRLDDLSIWADAICKYVVSEIGRADIQTASDET